MKKKSIDTDRKISTNRRLSCMVLIGIIGLFLAGCASVGPDFEAVRPDVPGKWHADMAGGLHPGETDLRTLSSWWEVFNDSTLTWLEKEAAENNLDLKLARARIREARAFRGVTEADRFPLLDASATAGKQRSSESGGLGTESEFYSSGFDAAWEIDVFGGTRRAIEAAKADFEASKEALKDTLVTLMAEVGLNYTELRTYQFRIALTRANIRSQQETYKLNKSRYDAGIIDELALQESLRIMESSRAQIPSLETGLQAAMNRIAVLLGKHPGELSGILSREKPIPVIPRSVAVGIPAKTIRRRPDIREAERKLAAQTARIGVATAELYPKFRLSGSIGLEAISSGDVFDWGSRVWKIAPGITWNIFNGGAVRKNIEVQKARQEQYLIQYQSTVLKALEEVENALTAYDREQKRLEALARAEAAAKQAEILARDRYQAGLVGFNNVLDAQRSLLQIQDQRAQSTGAVAANLVRLYKALGGGWQQLPRTGENHPKQ